MRQGFSSRGIWRVIYEFIVRSFFAMFSPPASGIRTTVRIRIGTETFHAQGAMPHMAGPNGLECMVVFPSVISSDVIITD